MLLTPYPSSILEKMENYGNPWGLSPQDRENWMEDYDVPLMREKKKTDVLYWAGCSGAYDTRGREISQAVTNIMNEAGVDYACLGNEETCTGDHSCIRLSGCPTLTVKTPKNKLKTDPVAHITQGCLGCGLCGENAIEASLCPSFWRAEVVTNPRWYERVIFSFRKIVLRSFI